MRDWYPDVVAALFGVLVTSMIATFVSSQSATAITALVLLIGLTIGIRRDLPIKVYRAIRHIDAHDRRTFNLSFWGILGTMLALTLAMGIYGEIEARFQWRALAADIEMYNSNNQKEGAEIEAEEWATREGPRGPKWLDLQKKAHAFDVSRDADAFVTFGDRIAIACENLARYGFLPSGPATPQGGALKPSFWLCADNASRTNATSLSDFPAELEKDANDVPTLAALVSVKLIATETCIALAIFIALFLMRRTISGDLRD